MTKAHGRQEKTRWLGLADEHRLPRSKSVGFRSCARCILRSQEMLTWWTRSLGLDLRSQGPFYHVCLWRGTAEDYTCPLPSDKDFHASGIPSTWFSHNEHSVTSKADVKMRSKFNGFGTLGLVCTLHNGNEHLASVR
jgi:hypothetical protein